MNEHCIVHPKFTTYLNYLKDQTTGWSADEIALHTFHTHSWPTCICEPEVETGKNHHYTVGVVYHNKLGG